MPIDPIPEMQIVGRFALAAALGGLVGWEREMHDQPAGLRTHIILSIGSALAACISIKLAMDYKPYVPNGDPARLVAQVISGIGFLGAGAIIRFGTHIKGLTTATSLWTVAIIGVAVGAGHFFSASVATGLLLFTLVTLNHLEQRHIIGVGSRHIALKAANREHAVAEFEQVVGSTGTRTTALSVTKDMAANTVEIKTVIQVSDRESMDALLQRLAAFPGVQSFSVE